MAGVAGKVAFITGAGSGIGRATALVLAKGGADVALCDVNLAGADAVAQEVSALGRRALALQVDVRRLEEVEAAVARTQSEFGRVDVLFSNAGIAEQVPFTELTEAQWDQMFNVHLNGTYNCFRAVLPGMRARDWGRLISTASVAGMEGGPQNAHYAAAKAAIIGFTRALAWEFARSGITVNAVAPGLIENILQAVQGQAEGSTVTGNIPSAEAEQVMQYFLRRIPMRQLGRPIDIAYAHLYLASDEAAYVTGQVLSPNGGYVM